MPSPPPAVSPQLLRPLLLALSERGISEQQLLDGSGVNPQELAQPGQRISESTLQQLWHHGMQLSGDPALGVKIGRVTDPQSFGLLGLVMLQAATVREALWLLQRFHALVYFAEPFAIERSSAAQAVLHLHRDPLAQPEQARPLVEFLIAALLRLSGFLAGGEARGGQYLRAVQFLHAAPAAAVREAYAETFRDCPIHYQAPDNAVHFDAALLAQPVAYADPQMLSLLKSRADTQLRALATEADLPSRVSACIRRRLLGRAPSISDIAADCHMSRASLQRHLAAANTGFRPLLDAVRYARAQELLRDTKDSTDTIAHLLGYADASAFVVAFRRWSGQTPGRWRGGDR